MAGSIVPFAVHCTSIYNPYNLIKTTTQGTGNLYIYNQTSSPSSENGVYSSLRNEMVFGLVCRGWCFPICACHPVAEAMLYNLSLFVPILTQLPELVPTEPGREDCAGSRCRSWCRQSRARRLYIYIVGSKFDNGRHPGESGLRRQGLRVVPLLGS